MIADGNKRKGKPPNPVCPVHGVMLVVRSTRKKKVQYLYCPEDGCKVSRTRAKPLADKSL
jgi:glycerol-3-phosphate dehydrogenase